LGIFTRRVIQRSIDASVSYAPTSARRTWVKKLNSSSSADYVAVEWELVVLDVLARLGRLQHEPKIGGASLLDAVFESKTLEFAADITTVSDRGIYEKNPIRLLEEELGRRYADSGITNGGFALYATTWLRVGKGAGRPTIIPPVNEFESIIFNQRFDTFLAKIKSNPSQQLQYQVFWERKSLIRITYVPGRKSVWNQGYTSFTVTTVIDKNPLFAALKDKADQLKKSGYQGLRGVIVCDGGADILRERFSSDYYSSSEVALEALRRHTSIDFVVTLSLRNIDSGTVRQKVESHIIVRMMEPWALELESLMSKVIQHLPIVLQTPENVRNEFKYWRGRETSRIHLERLSMKSGRTGVTEIRMSTRTLMDVLSGRLSIERFNKHYNFVKNIGVFEHQLRSGRLIESATVEKLPDGDSDEIVFKFGDPDPAIAPFSMPETEQLKP